MTLQEAILKVVRNSRYPLTKDELIIQVRKECLSGDNVLLKEVWRLLDIGTLQLTSDRRIELRPS